MTEEYIPNERSRLKSQGKKKLNEIVINNLPDKEFKALVIKMFIELNKRI